MPRILYDSITPSAIPRDAKMVAGYVDGLYRWTDEDWALFPNAVHVTITALGHDNAVVLNLEPNGYWPADLGVGWVLRARARGVDPTIYLNYRNHLALVQAAFDRAGVPRPHFWVAEYNGVQNIPDGTIAKQYAAPEGTGAAHTPGHYDLSIVADHWPGIDTGDDMSEEAERRIGYINDALGGAYDQASGKTIGTRVADLDQRIGYIEKALGDAYDPATDTTIGDRVVAIESTVKELRTSGVPVTLSLSEQDKADIAKLVLDGLAGRLDS